MIDLKVARTDAERYRAALARKGAADVFDELLDADRRWRDLETRVGELRAQTKLKGKPTPEQLDELTAREREVVALVACGLSNEEIADRLYLSVRTVERHLTNAYAKLRLSGKAARAAAAARFSQLRR